MPLWPMHFFGDGCGSDALENSLHTWTEWQSPCARYKQIRYKEVRFTTHFNTKSQGMLALNHSRCYAAPAGQTDATVGICI